MTVMIHSGSRGLGYQVCDDALKDLRGVPRKYGIDLPDKQLVCAPVESKEGRHYLGAMRAAANYAWCNRQIMTHLARQAFGEVFGTPAERLGGRGWRPRGWRCGGRPWRGRRWLRRRIEDHSLKVLPR